MTTTTTTTTTSGGPAGGGSTSDRAKAPSPAVVHTTPESGYQDWPRLRQGAASSVGEAHSSITIAVRCSLGNG